MFDESPFELERFTGLARLFPLPNLVIYPHVMQPLRIFEPRYLALLEEALASDGLIALTLLSPGWEGNYEGRPPIYSNACLCRVVTYHKAEDETYNILIVGVRRLQILEELPPEKTFRVAQVQVMEDDYPNASDSERDEIQKKLLTSFKHHLPKMMDLSNKFDELLGQEMGLGILTDIISYTLELPLTLKMELLSEANVDRRAGILTDYFETLADTNENAQLNETETRAFPPNFSVN